MVINLHLRLPCGHASNAFAHGRLGALSLFFFSSSLSLSSLELSDAKVYEPSIRALLGTASHFCEVVSYSEIAFAHGGLGAPKTCFRSRLNVKPESSAADMLSARKLMILITGIIRSQLI